MIKAAIFDMDGVIVDSEPIHSQSLEILIKKYGKKPIYNSNGLIHKVGVSSDEEYIKLLDRYGLAEEADIFRKKRRRIYIKLLKRPLTSMKGFIPLINSLKKEGIKIGLASNRYQPHIKLILENIGILELFDVIVGRDKDFKPKPAPDIYLKTAKKLKVDPKFCVAFEDSESGIISAKSAGMTAIAVPNKYTSDQDFSRADLIVKSLIEIKWNIILNYTSLHRSV